MIVDVYLRPVPAGNANDPWLFDPTATDAVASLPRDDRPARRRQPLLPEPKPIRAVSLFNDLVARYGSVKGNQIYRAMETEKSGPFAPGNKYGGRRRARRRKPDA